MKLVHMQFTNREPENVMWFGRYLSQLGLLLQNTREGVA